MHDDINALLKQESWGNQLFNWNIVSTGGVKSWITSICLYFFRRFDTGSLCSTESRRIAERISGI